MAKEKQNKKPRSRWVGGNERYDEATEKTIAKKYREQFGWHQGAKVRRDVQ